MANSNSTPTPQGSRLRKQYIRMGICLGLLLLAVLIIVVFALLEDPPEALAWLTVLGFASILPLAGLAVFHAVRASSIKRELAGDSGEGTARGEYRSTRTDFIQTIGIIMVALGILLAFFGGLHTKLEHDRSTAVAVGTVVGEQYTTDEDGKSIRKAKISYTLPDGQWLVLYESDLEVGAEVNVWYNPDNPEEKYIEGLEESPFYYVWIGFCGAALGAGAIILSRLTRKKPEINDVVDMIDR